MGSDDGLERMFQGLLGGPAVQQPALPSQSELAIGVQSVPMVHGMPDALHSLQSLRFPEWRFAPIRGPVAKSHRCHSISDCLGSHMVAAMPHNGEEAG